LAFFFYLFGHGGLPVTDSRPRASLAENERARTRSLWALTSWGHCASAGPRPLPSFV